MNIIDSLIEPFSPSRALRRATDRKKLQALKSIDVQNHGYSRHGASRIKKALTGWISRGASPDEDIVENIKDLRDRSRDLYMGSPIATGALKTIRTNVVGAGLKLNASIDHEFLGLSSDQADAIEKEIEREWKLWANTQHCDASRTCTFGQLQSLALISALAAGDVFAMLPVKKRKGSVYDLRVALIEADRVCNPEPLPVGQDIVGGVEIDEYGAPTHYHIAQHHPGARIRTANYVKREWKRVPVFGPATGRRNVLHIVQDLERPGQRRAAPLLAPVIESLKQLTRYTEAELMAAVVSGMFTVFVKSDTPDEPLGQAIPEDQQLDHDDRAGYQKDENSYELGNGAIIGLGENESIETANPGRPNTAFDGFVNALSWQVGAAIELPKEVLQKVFNSSYSASRAALLEAWKMFRMRRTWLVDGFCQPVYEEWLAEAVAKGRIYAPGFFDSEAVRAAWCGAEWYGPAQGQLDPLKEANAARVRVEEEFSTREREAAEMTGMSWESIHPVRMREERARREGGTIPITNTQAVSGQEQSEEDDDNAQTQ